MWKRYIYAAICIFVFTGLKADWGMEPREPLVLFRMEEDYSISFPILPAVVAFGVLVYAMLIAKRDNWWLIGGATFYLMLFLANL